jgi:hypothetical protein
MVTCNGPFMGRADDIGVSLEGTGQCGDCGLPARRQPAFTSLNYGNEFLSCAVGHCGFFLWACEYDARHLDRQMKLEGNHETKLTWL